jgi:hypothetical protein
MAVGTKEAKVFQPGVTIVPIYVVELEWNEHALPDSEGASFTSWLKNARSQQSPFQPEGLDGHCVGEVSVQGLSKAKQPITAPRPTREVRRVDVEALERPT